MRSQLSNNGSPSPPSNLNIPFNFIVSEGGFINSKGIKIAVPVIFDPAAANNFIQGTLVRELGWDLISGRYSIIRMNEIEDSGKSTNFHSFTVPIYDITHNSWNNFNISSSFYVSNTIPKCVILGINTISQMGISFKYDENNFLVPCINDPDKVPVLNNASLSFTAKLANLNLHDRNTKSLQSKIKTSSRKSINGFKSHIVLDDARKDVSNTDLFRKPQVCFCFVNNSSITSDNLFDDEDEDENLEENEIKTFLPKEYHSYIDVFKKITADTLPPHRPGLDCEIVFKEGAVVKKCKNYPINPRFKQEADDYVQDMENKGFIRESKSPFACSMLFRSKKDGSSRPCIDFRPINEVTVRDPFPLPLYMTFFDQIKGSKIFTKLDLRSAYNLIRIRDEDVWKTSFRTPKGQYEYLVMPFGLKNAPAVFQRFINYIMKPFLDKFVAVYLDDILIYSKNKEEHISHVCQVLSVLKENHLAAKASKCEFHRPEVEFLGHVISGSGIKTDPKKISALKDWPTPSTVKEVQSFVGFCNYYRRFVKNFASIAKPLHNLTKKDSKFVWTDECNSAFLTLKDILCSSQVLIQPDPNKPYKLETDASKFAIGCVLSQKVGNNYRPIGYFSRTLNNSERNYSVTDKELLAIVCGLQEWEYLLLGALHPIDIFTDHRNLLFSAKPKLLSQREKRWQDILAHYNFNIHHVSGEDNGKADKLSRRPDFNSSIELKEELIIDPKCFMCYCSFQDPLLTRIKSEVLKDDWCSELLKALKNEPFNAKVLGKINISNCKFENNLLFFNNLIIVPKSCIPDVLFRNHDIPLAGHMGINRTLELVSRNFYWKQWHRDVRNYVRSCPTCQQMKHSTKPKNTFLTPIPIKKCPWQSIEIDFLTDLYSSKFRNTCSIMVVCDRLTKMTHFVLLIGTPTADSAIQGLMESVFCIHGFPREIITDRGSQFTSSLWSEIMTIIGIDHRVATTGHHQTVGQAERLNQHIEQYLRCFIRYFGKKDWTEWLCMAEFVYNNTAHVSTGQPPFLSFNGFLPSMLHPNDSVETIEHLTDYADNIDYLYHTLLASQELYKKHYDTGRRSSYRFKPNDWVWIKKPSEFISSNKKLCPRKYGPFKILKSDKFFNYKLDISKSPFPEKHPWFHCCELEPFIARDPKFYKPLFDNKTAIKIVDCKFNETSYFAEYLVLFDDDSESWIDCYVIDNDDSFDQLIRDFNSSHPDFT